MESTTGMLSDFCGPGASCAANGFWFGYMGSGDMGHCYVLLLVDNNKSYMIKQRSSYGPLMRSVIKKVALLP